MSDGMHAYYFSLAAAVKILVKEKAKCNVSVFSNQFWTSISSVMCLVLIYAYIYIYKKNLLKHLHAKIIVTMLATGDSLLLSATEQLAVVLPGSVCVGLLTFTFVVAVTLVTALIHYV